MAFQTPTAQVALAGTVINSDTGDVMPGAVVTLTAAPPAFTQQLGTFLRRYLAQYPLPQGGELDISRGWPSLYQLQLLLDDLQLHQHPWFSPPQFLRPDQRITGGDGHYHFLDLPAGFYDVTARYKTLTGCVGLAQHTVEIAQGNNLSFTQLDITVRVDPWATHESHYAPPQAGGLGAPLGGARVAHRA